MRIKYGYGPKIDYNANYRPVISSERTPQFIMQIFSYQNKRTNLVMGPKGEPTPTETGRIIVCRISGFGSITSCVGSTVLIDS
jgi:hypothetical protein